MCVCVCVCVCAHSVDSNIHAVQSLDTVGIVLNGHSLSFGHPTPIIFRYTKYSGKTLSDSMYKSKFSKWPDFDKLTHLFYEIGHS